MSGNGWSALDIGQVQRTGNTTPLVVSGVQTGQVVSREPFRISAGGAIDGLVIKISTSSASVTGSIVFTLQTAFGLNDWVSSKTVSASTQAGAAQYYISLLGTRTADQTYLPLLNQGRIICTTTNAADTVTITGVELLQPLG